MHAAQPAEWRRRAEALGSLRDASGELPAGHRRSHHRCYRQSEAIDRARLSTERGYRQSGAPPRSSSGSSGSSCRTRAGLQLEAAPAGLSRSCSEASSSVTPLATAHMPPTRRSDRLLRNHRSCGGRHPATDDALVRKAQLGLPVYRPLSYTCAALTCRPPEERAVRRSTATTRRPRSACSGASRPTSTVRAHLTTPPPALRAHACVAHTTRPGAGACQVRGASAEAAMGVSSGRRRRAACCLRHRRSSHAARRR